jgi:hypothetical protein
MGVKVRTLASLPPRTTPKNNPYLALGRAEFVELGLDLTSSSSAPILGGPVGSRNKLLYLDCSVGLLDLEI